MLSINRTLKLLFSLALLLGVQAFAQTAPATKIENPAKPLSAEDKVVALGHLNDILATEAQIGQLQQQYQAQISQLQRQQAQLRQAYEKALIDFRAKYKALPDQNLMLKTAEWTPPAPKPDKPPEAKVAQK